MDNDHGAYITLGIASTAYAVTLNTEAGKEFADKYTWASVVLGTGIVLTVLRTIIPKAIWEKVVLSFIVAGSPIIARSLINQQHE